MASRVLEYPSCPTCYESFDDQDFCPRILRCGHTVCSFCLGNLIRYNTDTICCPICRKTMYLLPAGVAEVPKNFLVLKIIDSSLPSHKGGEGLPICDVCASDNQRHPANSYCLDCDEDMCSDAVRFHSRNKTSRDHRTVSLEPSAVSVKCSKHDKEFRLFDKNCGSMVCRSCITCGDSRDHQFVSLADAGSQCKQEMEELATRVSSRTKVVRTREDCVMDLSHGAEISLAAHLSRIESVFQELRTAITEREKKLKNELGQLHMSKKAFLTEKQQSLRKCQVNIESTVQDALSTIHSLDNASLLAERSNLELTLVAMLKQSFKVLQLEAQSVPEFAFNRSSCQYVLEAVNKVGVVMDKSTCAETTTAAGSGLEHAKPGEMACFNITARDARNNARSLGGDVFEVKLINESGEKVSAYVQDKDNGSYYVSYTIPAGAERVDHTLSVKLQGAHIQGSPFTVQVSSSHRRKLSKTFSNVAGKHFQN